MRSRSDLKLVLEKLSTQSSVALIDPRKASVEVPRETRPPQLFRYAVVVAVDDGKFPKKTASNTKLSKFIIKKVGVDESPWRAKSSRANKKDIAATIWIKTLVTSYRKTFIPLALIISSNLRAAV